MDTLELEAGNAMYAALNNLPCSCKYNVPYADGQVKRVLTDKCARCRSMLLWLEVKNGAPTT